MEKLHLNLEMLGYDCIRPNLPLTFKEFDHAASVLEQILEELVSFHLEKDELIHLVGHSTGGLVIRKLISETKYTASIGRCVLIATPNKGCKLANIAGKLKPVVRIYKTLRSLDYDYVEKVDFTPKFDRGIEVAAIAGNKNNLLLGNLIGSENDGRVELESVYYPELKDFITLPYGHLEIHQQPETAKWIDAFLRSGKFR
jgi:pimeloyl-ACP methyl ester carboxylesterase